MQNPPPQMTESDWKWFEWQLRRERRFGVLAGFCASVIAVVLFCAAMGLLHAVVGY